VSKELVRGETPVRVFNKEFADDVFSFATNLLPCWSIKIEFNIFNLLKKYKVILIIERWAPT
jgi:hypothetical protein